MTAITPQTILILSPQSWRGMWVSKHHYALTLADMGHNVWFMEPPKVLGLTPSALQQEPCPDHPNITLCTYTLPAWLRLLRFKARSVYDFLIQRYIKLLLPNIGVIDQLWSFEAKLYKSFAIFGAKKVMFFPADVEADIYRPEQLNSCTLICSIAENILEPIPAHIPTLLLNHGLGKAFAAYVPVRIAELNTYAPNIATLKVGFSGNLLKKGIDQPIMQQLIAQHPDVEFHIWGVFTNGGNIGGVIDAPTQAFLDFLQQQSHVYLHGAVPQAQLAAEMQAMDIFLLCQDMFIESNASSNSHKLIEYLSTGRVVVSNHVSAYRKYPNILTMLPDSDNKALLTLFADVKNNIAAYNAADKQQIRIEFAAENTYSQQTQRILTALQSV